MIKRSGVTGKTYYEPLGCTASNKNQIATCSVGYDAAGNMTSNGSATYTYDAEKRLTATAGYTYTYDGDGKRVKKSNGSTGTVYWTGIGGSPLVESNLTGAFQREYIFFDGKRVARRDADSTVHYYFPDHLGSARVITDALGTMPPQKEIDYYPYGGEAFSTGSDPNSYKFTGQERDSESTFDYFGARHFGSQLSRFMTGDEPLVDQYEDDPPSWNLYAYVRSNPLRYTDPTGTVCVVDENGNEHDDDRRGETCAQVHQNDKMPTVSAQVTASPMSAVESGWENTKWFVNYAGEQIFGNWLGLFLEASTTKDPLVGTLAIASMVTPGRGRGASAKRILAKRALLGSGVKATARNASAKRAFLKQLAASSKTPSWMKQWLAKGKVPPGYNVDHIKPLSVGGADDPSNMRLVLTEDHVIHHGFYHPWR